MRADRAKKMREGSECKESQKDCSCDTYLIVGVSSKGLGIQDLRQVRHIPGIRDSLNNIQTSQYVTKIAAKLVEIGGK